MDYYQQARTTPHSGAPAQSYMYSQSSAPSNSGVYYQQVNHYQQPFTMQPSVSQGNSMGSQNAVSSAMANQRRQRNEVGGIHRTGLPSEAEVPLRMLVDAKYVGAIIGQQGNSIREITRESKARCIVDSQKGIRDAQGVSEKGISIYSANPEGASKAVVKILEVVEKEKEKEREKADREGLERTEEKPHEVELKLRAHNQLVGRLIGKQGSTIKKIMAETETVIFVSNDTSMPQGLSLVPPMYAAELTLLQERTITVRAASIAQVSAAEQKISAKLRHSLETDFNNRVTLGAGTLPIVNPLSEAYQTLASYRPPAISNSPRTAKMYVPNNMVGAIIGSKGQNIRQIMRTTGANMRIEGGEKKEKTGGEGESVEGEGREKKEKTGGEGESVEGDGRETETASSTGEEKKEKGSKEEGIEEERLVTIHGNDHQIFRAQFCVFQKIAEQSAHYVDDVKLRTEMTVPSRLVGRIIGKGGQNVRELQRITGAQVKIAEEDMSSEREEKKEEKKEEKESEAETTVRILGNVNATIAVQVRISTLVNDFNRLPATSTTPDRAPNGASAGVQSGCAE